MSHKSKVAGKDDYLYAGVMTEAHPRNLLSDDTSQAHSNTFQTNNNTRTFSKS